MKSASGIAETETAGGNSRKHLLREFIFDVIGKEIHSQYVKVRNLFPKGA